MVASFPGSSFALYFVGVRGEPKSEANIALPLHDGDATSQLYIIWTHYNKCIGYVYFVL